MEFCARRWFQNVSGHLDAFCLQILMLQHIEESLEQCQPNVQRLDVRVVLRLDAIGCLSCSSDIRVKSKQIGFNHAPKANQLLRGQTQSNLSQLYSCCTCHIATLPHCVREDSFVETAGRTWCPFSGTGTKTTHGELYIMHPFKKKIHERNHFSQPTEMDQHCISHRWTNNCLWGGCPSKPQKNSGKVFDHDVQLPTNTDKLCDFRLNGPKHNTTPGGGKRPVHVDDALQETLIDDVCHNKQLKLITQNKALKYTAPLPIRICFCMIWEQAFRRNLHSHLTSCSSVLSFVHYLSCNIRTYPMQGFCYRFASLTLLCVKLVRLRSFEPRHSHGPFRCPAEGKPVRILLAPTAYSYIWHRMVLLLLLLHLLLLLLLLRAVCCLDGCCCGCYCCCCCGFCCSCCCSFCYCCCCCCCSCCRSCSCFSCFCCGCCCRYYCMFLLLLHAVAGWRWWV